MKTLKPKVWKRILSTKDWGTKFTLLLDEKNYEPRKKASKNTKKTPKTN